MQTETMDLIDYQSLKVDSLEEESAVEYGYPHNLRLLWSGDSVESVTGFSFKPVFSYEHEAVCNLSIYQASPLREGWFDYIGEQGNAADAIAELLDSTLWRGRPVLQGMADYWVALDFNDGASGKQRDGEKHYQTLLDTMREASPDRQSAEVWKRLDEGFTAPLALDHNLITPIWRLLGHFKHSNGAKPESYCWVSNGTELFMGHDHAHGKLKAILAEVELRLWFMGERVLLLQWRLHSATPEKTSTATNNLSSAMDAVSVAKGCLRQLLEVGASRDAGWLNIDEWLSVHQSLRWNKQSFQAQKREGRYFSELEGALKDALKSALAFGELNIDGKRQSCGSYISDLVDNRADEQRGVNMHDPRRYCSWSVTPLSAQPGQRFNGALQRAWAHLLGNDTPMDSVNPACDNYAFDKAFIEHWIDQRTYKRWADTGIQYGFSDFSATAMGTSNHFRGQVFCQDWPGLYSELTRLCLYQQTRLRSMAMAFSDTLDKAGASDVEAMQLHMQTMRDELQRFNRNAWFHRVSTQLQPEELYQLQKTGMDLQGLYRSVRDEFEDVSAWLAAEQAVLASQESKRQQKRDRLLALIGLAIAVPGVLQIWGAGEAVSEASAPSRGLLAAFWAMLGSGDFWLLLAMAFIGDQLLSAGRWRKRLTAWLGNLFSRA